jgi:hypothetical protein
MFCTFLYIFSYFYSFYLKNINDFFKKEILFKRKVFNVIPAEIVLTSSSALFTLSTTGSIVLAQAV